MAAMRTRAWTGPGGVVLPMEEKLKGATCGEPAFIVQNPACILSQKLKAAQADIKIPKDIKKRDKASERYKK